MRENNKEWECDGSRAKYTSEMGWGCYTPRSKDIPKKEMQKQEQAG